MEQLVNTLTRWLTAFFDFLGSIIGGIVRLFETPAQMIGLPAELFAAFLLCLVLIALWRTMSRFII